MYTYSQSMHAADYDSSTYKGDDDDDNGNGNGNGNNDNNGNGGDNQNYLEVTANTNLSFTCSSPQQLENTQTLPNAISLKFKTKSSDCSVYAKISAFNKPSAANFSDFKLYLDWTNDNSQNAQQKLQDPVLLTMTDQRLFVQPKKSQAFHFDYNLQLGAMGYEAPAGQYTYTILFTMTQP